ncbi:Piso0_004218 [Millerozyma farinosa CBS 7064]|uniref:RNA helicase n=1 Tax=Pichia sorbitophila (strain ATCC MYA-4447 / BCRC 22081 / CBS 7064 / NBRC 10061 / NRRL Y-12695) TaxID=559304 RepID=G8Y7T5_PICSO|nr:Piso0_004218 [Millerozyma farinosa CBS 7064]CCE84665.1 Piso0_004218 [Millerozyma farinosa CBS 7064]
MTSKKGQDAIDVLTRTISTYLNKDVNQQLTQKVVSFYLQNNKLDAFLQKIAILGFPTDNDNKAGKEIYSFISENISNLELVVNHIKPKITSGKEPDTKVNKSIPSLDFGSLDEDDDNDIFDRNDKANAPVTSFKKPSVQKQHSRRAPSLLYDSDELEDELDIPKPDLAKNIDNNKPSKVKTQTFKRLKKEDANKIKQYDSTNVNSGASISVKKDDSGKKQEKVNLCQTERKSLSQLASEEREQAEKAEKERVLEEDSLDIDGIQDLENDREWYNDEGFVQDYNLNEETEIPLNSKENSKFKNSLKDSSGGTFDKVTGEYVDFDHDYSKNDFSRIPIKPHFYVPPFLEEWKDSIIIETNKNLVKNGRSSLSLSIPVVKDPASELAQMAKRGSYIAKENKSKREKALQAIERSSSKSSVLGHIINNSSKKTSDTDKTNDASTKNNDEIDAEDTVSNSREDIIQSRKNLPAFAVKNKLLQVISENQVTIVIGETGSGKTTQLAQYIYESGYTSARDGKNNNKIIGCTQPRRVAAMSVAKRVSEEMGCKLGEEVGYAIRFEDRTKKGKTVIKYMTEGVLLSELLTDSLLDKYSCIIMDEAHERSVNTDILLGLFKKLCAQRRDLKLIITSATMNADKFSTFFGNAPQFTIPGRTFPVDVFFSKSISFDYVDTAVRQVLTIHLQQMSNNNKNDGDILVFMTGQEDIEATCSLLEEKLGLLDNPPPLDVYPIYSTLPADVQKKIFRSKSDSRRKVVVATNIAETSLTVDGIKYVIDTGLVKLKVFNPKIGMDSLQVIPISAANAQQRSGRAGRTGPGVSYRLYTEKSFSEQMYPMPIPEIQRANLSNVLLMLKFLKVDNVSKFPFLDPPPRELLSCSLYYLWSIGAIDHLGSLTSLGHDMCKFPLEPSLSKLILLSCSQQYHCSDEVLSIVAMLSVPPVYYRPKERAKEADQSREKFSIGGSDHLTLLNIYTQWERQIKKSRGNSEALTDWCNRNFFHKKSLMRARDIRNQLVFNLQKNKYNILKSRNDDDIKKCLCAAFFNQSARLTKVNMSGYQGIEYHHLRHTYMSLYLHPTSVLNDSTSLAPTFVVYHELILTSKEYMNCVTSVDPLWLLEFGSVFYETTSDVEAKLADACGFKIKDRRTFEKELEDAKHVLEAAQREKTGGHKKSLAGSERKFLQRRRAF